VALSQARDAQRAVTKGLVRSMAVPSIQTEPNGTEVAGFATMSTAIATDRQPFRMFESQACSSSASFSVRLVTPCLIISSLLSLDVGNGR
jgi:hypothetical protein